MGEIGANFNFASLFHYTQELCIKKFIFWNFRKYSSLILEQNSRTLIFLAIRLLQLQQKIRKVGICSIISKQKNILIYCKTGYRHLHSKHSSPGTLWTHIIRGGVYSVVDFRIPDLHEKNYVPILIFWGNFKENLPLFMWGCL